VGGMKVLSHLAVQIPLEQIMASIQLQDVTVPGHVEWSVTTGGEQGEDQLRIEVYTGNLIVQFPAGDTTKRDTYFTYLPLSVDPDGAFYHIRQYGPDAAPPAINSAIVVTPISVHSDDKEFTASVDTWGLQVTPQSFPGIGGQPPVLILSCDLAVRNGVIIRVGYHVTVTTPLSTAIATHDLKPFHAPQ
jgi:hypothetical protein